MNKEIMQDASTGKPIMVGHYIFGTAKREDGSLVKFDSVQLIEIVTGLFGVLYKEEMFTVMPYNDSPQIIKSFRHSGIASNNTADHQGVVDLPQADKPVMKSRKLRKAEEEMEKNLNHLTNIFFTFKLSHKDPDGEEVADKFEELDKVWVRYCGVWKNSPKRMKLSDNISPNPESFEARVKKFEASMPKPASPSKNKKDA